MLRGDDMRATLCAINSKYVHSTLAIWYLKSAVGEKCQCAIVEGTINENVENIVKRIVESRPELVAFSTYIWNKECVMYIAEQVKETTKAKILLGGPEVSYNAKEILEGYPFVDYVISGEGEEPFSKLCCGDSVESIEGLCYKKSGGVFVKDAYVSKNDPPNPYTNEYFESLNGRITYIETSRGCPYSCAFCLSGRCGGVRFFDLEEAKKRIVLLANSGTQTVKFIDRTFNASRKRARDIFSFLIGEYKKSIPEGVSFHFEIEGELLDEETFEILKMAPKGLIQFEIGLQSYNEKTLESINRKTNLGLLTENIRRILSLGNIHTHIDLIIGLPHEGLESFKRSFDLAYKLKPHMLQVGFLKLLYGAALREQTGEQKCTFTDTPPYEIISNQWITAEEIKILHSFEDVFEKLYNSKRFALTCQYLESLYESSFDMFMELSKCLMKKKMKTLDEFTEAVYKYFIVLPFVDRNKLRDTLAIDRLATNRMGALPEFLKVKHPNFKKTLNFLEKNEGTKHHEKVKRAATPLLTENKVAYVDYDHCDYLTNRFLVKFTEICDK